MCCPSHSVREASLLKEICWQRAAGRSHEVSLQETIPPYVHPHLSHCWFWNKNYIYCIFCVLKFGAHKNNAVCLSFCFLSVCLSVCMCLYVYLSVCLSVCLLSVLIEISLLPSNLLRRCKIPGPLIWIHEVSSKSLMFFLLPIIILLIHLITSLLLIASYWCEGRQQMVLVSTFVQRK